jgi:hypothetical protein
MNAWSIKAQGLESFLNFGTVVLVLLIKRQKKNPFGVSS